MWPNYLYHTRGRIFSKACGISIFIFIIFLTFKITHLPRETSRQRPSGNAKCEIASLSVLYKGQQLTVSNIDIAIWSCVLVRSRK